MRPIIKPSISRNELQTKPVDALLINAFGPYCMLSERPLPDIVYLWHPRKQMSPKTAATQAQWKEVMLLDPATFAALEDSENTLVEDLLLPGREATFNLTAKSPFTYDLEDVSVTYLGDDGKPEGDPETEQLVIVRGANKRARATIEAFALNGRGFDAKTSQISIRRSDYLSRSDHRVQDRTLVWHRAMETAELISQIEEPTVRDRFLAQVRLTIAGTGYWSIWATVLWKQFQDKDILRQTMLEAPERVERLSALLVEGDIEAEPHQIGPGPHNAFPGTDPGWL